MIFTFGKYKEEHEGGAWTLPLLEIDVSLRGGIVYRGRRIV